jgi:hypothetical protein
VTIAASWSAGHPYKRVPTSGGDGGLPAQGVTRKVDELVRALGADSGISKSEVSRIRADLDAEVGSFGDWSLAGSPFPCVFLDATESKTGSNRRVVSQAVVVATGVRSDGWREGGRVRRRRLRRRRVVDRPSPLAN